MMIEEHNDWSHEENTVENFDKPTLKLLDAVCDGVKQPTEEEEKEVVALQENWN
tara:strand:- start:217 stop:378 length:162 start_codon:yes stop_codon:yes gene_type:complete